MQEIIVYGIDNKHKDIWKYIIFIICSIALIVGSAFMGIFLAEKRYEQYVKEQIDKEIQQQGVQQEQQEGQQEKDEQIQEIQKIEAKYKIPIATETGKNNMNNIYNSDYKRVFLTFDDGPSSNITPLILDTLKANNIKATFFTLGSRVEQNPQIVKRAYEEGHYIANHGYSHVYANVYASIDSLLSEYNRTEEAIRTAIEIPEYSSHLFRFPGGSAGGKYHSVKANYKKTLSEQGIFYLDWNCLNEDATGNRTKEQLVQYIKDTSANKNSVVVLMHDAGDKILTYETLQEVIDYFKENGYVFESLYDIIECDLISKNEENTTKESE